MNDPKPSVGVVPDRPNAIPDSYAIYVGRDAITVWQYRVNISSPDGDWYLVESLDRNDDPTLSLDHATLQPPTDDGYWIYAQSYDCELDCP